MNTDRLKLMQWLSPAFPVGGYAYSHGLEATITRGDVSDAKALGAWLDGVLRFGAGRSDAILLVLAMKGEDVSDLAQALCGSAERWEETRAQGQAFGATINALYDEDLDDVALPVAVGQAARRLSLRPGEVATLYLHSFASNLVSAAVRFMPLGQVAGQSVLDGLHDTIAMIGAEAAEAGPDDIATSAFGVDMAAMEHEVMAARIFRT